MKLIVARGEDRAWNRLKEIRALDEEYHLARHRAIYDLIDRGIVLGSSTDKDALELQHPQDTSHSVFVVAPVGDMLHLVELRRGEQTEFFRLLDRKSAKKAGRWESRRTGGVLQSGTHGLSNR